MTPSEIRKMRIKNAVDTAMRSDVRKFSEQVSACATLHLLLNRKGILDECDDETMKDIISETRECAAEVGRRFAIYGN